MNITETVEPDAVVDAIKNAVLNARDFCGSEKEAIVEAFIDATQGQSLPPGITRQALMRKGVDAANAEWKRSQAAAGVSRPISTGERVAIHRALEDEASDSPGM